MRVTYTIETGISATEAIPVIDRAMASYSEKLAKHDPKFQWTGDKTAELGFSASGLSVTGTLTARDNGIDLDLDVPFVLRPFKKRAIGVIEDEVRRWLEEERRPQRRVARSP